VSVYERFTLILDSESTQLGQTAIRMLELGIDVLYAKDPDEAVLLARQESSRLGAVLIPTTLDLGPDAGLLRRLCTGLDAGHGCLIIAGLEPESEILEALQRQAVEWCLWEPYGERELRFVLSAAMSIEHESERRGDLRVPTAIETTVFMGRHRKPCVVHDLSVSGAYLAAPDPFLAGSRLSVDIALTDGTVLAKAEVVRDKTSEVESRNDVPEGMGIRFSSFAPGSQERLRAFVTESILRFRL
jgi:hypothetical protein